jgi:hypothetical protein
MTDPTGKPSCERRERVNTKSPVREYRPPGSVRGALGNRRPYLDKPETGGRKAKTRGVKKRGAKNRKMGRASNCRCPLRPPPCDFRFPVLRSETAEGGLLSQFQLFSPPAGARAGETLKLERLPNAECGMQNAEWLLLRLLRPHVANRPAPNMIISPAKALKGGGECGNFTQ